MKDRLIELLETFGYPVLQQGSMSDEEEYPMTFITYWNNETPQGMFYDNRSHKTDWDFDVNIYTCDVLKLDDKLNEIIDLLQANGFVVDSNGYDVMSDEKTHVGRGVNVIYAERKK